MSYHLDRAVRARKPPIPYSPSPFAIRRIGKNADTIHTPGMEVTDVTKPYAFNKIRSLQKKLDACDKAHFTYTEKDSGNARLHLSTAAYELVKNRLPDCIRASNLIGKLVQQKDVDRNIAQQTYKFHYKKKDGTEGRYPFTLNMYATTSSLLINGNGIQWFRDNMLPQIQKTIEDETPNLDAFNVFIRNATLRHIRPTASSTARCHLKPSEPHTDNLAELTDSLADPLADSPTDLTDNLEYPLTPGLTDSLTLERQPTPDLTELTDYQTDPLSDSLADLTENLEREQTPQAPRP